MGKKKKVPRRVIHFVSGETMEEYSTDEDEVDGLDKKDVLPTVDPVCLALVTWPAWVCPWTLNGRDCWKFKPTTIHYDLVENIIFTQYGWTSFQRFSDLNQFCIFVAELVIGVNLCEALVSPVFESESLPVHRVSVLRGNTVHWSHVYSGHLRGSGLDAGHGAMACINYMGVQSMNK